MGRGRAVQAPSLRQAQAQAINQDTAVIESVEESLELVRCLLRIVTPSLDLCRALTFP